MVSVTFRFGILNGVGSGEGLSPHQKIFEFFHLETLAFSSPIFGTTVCNSRILKQQTEQTCLVFQLWGCTGSAP